MASDQTRLSRRLGAQMRPTLQALSAVVLASALASPAFAEPTDVVVRAISRDAKFIGDSMGGVRIVIRDALTREILAEGVTAGGTGDTKRLMETATRRDAWATPESAAFRATLDIDEPRLIEVEAYGPLGQRQAAVHVTSQQWLIPGGHVREGNGWLIEMPGFVVDVLDPPAASNVKMPAAIKLRANVVMMCGCPTSPGGLWDANQYEIVANIQRDGKLIAKLPMSFSGTTSQYEATFTPEATGVYNVIVTAYDARNGNTGVDRTTVTVALK